MLDWEVTKHEPIRCVVVENSVFDGTLAWRDFGHVDEICEQLYMDHLGTYADT